MLILITALLLFLTALAIVILQIMRPEFRFTWLTAVGGALLAWISVLLWQTNMPLSFKLPAMETGESFFRITCLCR